jgi:hypothetical protein
MKYMVDWDDAAFPSIRVATDGEEGTTLTEAKGEIIDHARNDIDHWRAIITRTRALRAGDLKDATETEA